MEENKNVQAATEVSDSTAAQPAPTVKGKCTDCRMFVIALVTSIIVVTLYHLGGKIFEMCCERDCSTQYKRVYVEINGDCPIKRNYWKGQKKFHGERKFHGKRFREMRREGMERRRKGMKRPKPAAERPDAVAKPAAPKAE